MTRYHATWLLPVSSPPLRDGTVVEAEGRIVYAGPRADAPEGGADVELGEALLMPGLVNAHCHLELTAMRGFLDGLGFREWILRLTHARQAVLTPQMLLDAARLGVAEGLQAGVTTYADTGDTGTGFDAMLEYGVRGICYREVFGPDASMAAAALRGLAAKVAEMRARATPLVRVGVSPHAPYTVSDALFRLTAEYAIEEQLPIAVHIAESQLESDLVERAEGMFADGLRRRGIGVRARGRSPVALLHDAGVLEARPLLIHCVRTDAEDHRVMARHECAVAHCPASNAKLGHGVAPVQAMLSVGLRMGLGSDSVASNDRMDILGEARLASLFATARELSPSALTGTTALELATIGGARALGMESEIGTLEVGKSADLAAFPIPEDRRPVHDPVAAAVFSLAGVRASFVVVGGRVLVKNGVLARRDPALAGRVQSSADALQRWLYTDLGSDPAVQAPRTTH